MQTYRLLIVPIWLALHACGAQVEPNAPEAQPTNPSVKETNLEVGLDGVRGISLGADDNPPLDLSRQNVERILDELTDEDLDFDDKSLLPDLFESSPDQQKMKISGGVLTNEEAQTLIDSVDGVELTIELTTP